MDRYWKEVLSEYTKAWYKCSVSLRYGEHLMNAQGALVVPGAVVGNHCIMQNINSVKNQNTSCKKTAKSQSHLVGGPSHYFS